MRNEITVKVCEILKEVLKYKDDNITEDSELIDMGIDSLRYMNIVVKLEDAYNVEFDDDFLMSDSFDRVRDIVTYLLEKVV